MDKKNLISLVILIIMVVTIPIGVYLVRQQQIINSRASASSITLTGSQLSVLPNGQPAIKLNDKGEAEVDLNLTSPLGPPR